MSKYKKVSIYIMFIVAFVLLLGVTYSFFNYTRTGSLNNLGTGRINFNSEQNGTLNITNAFPIKSEELNIDNLDEITIEIEGDTTYSEGEEFEVKIVEVSNTVSGKRLPINYIATYEAKENKTIGLPSEDYWNEREAKDSNIYLLNETGEVKGNTQILVGYIKNDNEGISGVLTIKAYVDGDKIAISDTYGGSEYTVNSNMSSEALSYCLEYFGLDSTGESFCRGESSMHGISFQEGIDLGYSSPEDLEDLTTHGVLIKHNYTNDTTYEWVNDRVVFTTEEWNSFTASETPISFKIRVESNEGIWASLEETPGSCFTYYVDSRYVRNENMNISSCVDILTNGGFLDRLNNNETLEDFCSGTGTIGNKPFQIWLDEKNLFQVLDELIENDIVVQDGLRATITDYDETCGENVVIPREFSYIKKSYGVSQSINQSVCVNTFTNLGLDKYLNEGESLETICDGTGTYNGNTLQECLDNEMLSEYVLEELLNANVIVESGSNEQKAKVMEVVAGRDYSGMRGKGLKTIVLPNTLTIIGMGAFSSNLLTSVVIPKSVTTIGDTAFSYNQLSNIHIPSNVSMIGNYAFANNNLTNIVLPNTLESIGNNAFSDNPNLTSATINLKAFRGEGGAPCSNTFVSRIGLNNLTSVSFGSDVRSIGTCAFFNGNLTSVNIPNGVEEINYNAFSGNKLTTVTIPSSVNLIDIDAFSNNLLTSVTIEEGVERIGQRAFINNQLTSITIPNSTREIGSVAFANNNISSLTIGSGITRSCSAQGNCTSMSQSAFDWSNVHFIDKTVINDHIFQQTTFTTLTLGPHVETIGQYAFTGADITSITIPATVNTIGYYAFEKKESSSIGSIIINRTCTDIKAMANYPWIGTNYRAGTTIYGLNNEICDSW